jgi:hypothetical protein
LNQLELQFLLLNDFRLTVHPDEMQRYAEQLVLFSQHQPSSPTSVRLARELGHSSPPAAAAAATGTVHSPAAYADYAGGPRQMGAFDAFGGALPADAPPALPADGAESECGASECGETEGGETDDEPTIRADRSCAGSECGGPWAADDDADADGPMGSS